MSASNAAPPPIPGAAPLGAIHAGLALQGGAAHGAFAWGVVDGLLEAGLRPAAISGVSSGALLGVAISQGWARDGVAGARAEMRRLWTRIGQANPMGGKAVGTGSLGHWFGFDLGDLAWQGWEAATRMFSPSQLNPLGHNPLRGVIEDLLDKAALTHPAAIPLHVSATDVETAAAVPFDNATVTVDALLASCCLPFVAAPVTVNGRVCWDGGYSGNPPLVPLLADGLPDDIVIVHAQPRVRRGNPATAADIMNRMHELAFQGILDAEITALPPRVRLRAYDADAALGALPASSKVNTDPQFLAELFQAGRAAAAA